MNRGADGSMRLHLLNGPAYAGSLFFGTVPKIVHGLRAKSLVRNQLRSLSGSNVQISMW